MQSKDVAGASGATSPDDSVSGKITDADIERARRQIGVPQYVRAKTYNPIADLMAMSHFASGMGEDNPLYMNRVYGKGTRWRDAVAHPFFAISAGVCLTPKFSPEQKELFRGLFRGVGKYHCKSSFDWYKPIYPGDELYYEHITEEVEVKKSRFGVGSSVLETYRTLYVNKAGEPVVVRRESFLSIEREGSQKGDKYADFKRTEYSDDDIRAIDKIYKEEKRRGPETLYWEDVEVGEQLQPVAKGPLTVTDILFSHMARGWGGYGMGPLRYAWEQRTQMPAFFTKDAYGVPDNVQRLHWDYDWAKKLGLPAPVDYGQQRICWLSHLITNWMGDDGWILNMVAEFRDFNFVGDMTICSGRVTGKRVENGQHLVDIEAHCKNQRDKITAPATAVVVLPSREHGAFTLPRPPTELNEVGARIMFEDSLRRRGAA